MIRRKMDLSREIRENMRGGKGRIVIEHLEKEGLPANGRLFAKIIVAPGGSIGRHRHDGESEIFYFLSGGGMVTDDGERIPVAAGDVLTTGDGHSHSVENTGDVDLEMIAVIIRG